MNELTLLDSTSSSHTSFCLSTREAIASACAYSVSSEVCAWMGGEIPMYTRLRMSKTTCPRRIISPSIVVASGRGSRCRRCAA